MMKMNYTNRASFALVATVVCLWLGSTQLYAQGTEGRPALDLGTRYYEPLCSAEHNSLQSVLSNGLDIERRAPALHLTRSLVVTSHFSRTELFQVDPGVRSGRGEFVLLADARHSTLAVNAVQRQIELFTVTLPDKFSQWLERSGRYRELIESILRMNGLPQDLVFLPLIESGYNPLAYSRARAVGPWQFIRGTAVKYGLKVNFWVDERRDPVKSTHAAARYLKELHERFESWALAMAAYNAGEGKISRALRKSRSYDYWPLLRTPYLRNETKHYVAKFIAARQIALNPAGYGFESLQYHPPLDFEEVDVPSPVDIAVIATAAETTYETIKELNPELRTWCTPLGVTSYSVRVPRGAAERLLENLREIPEEKRLSLVSYTVKRGDTLSNISKKEGIPREVVMAINDLSAGARIQPGTVIYLPPSDKLRLCREIVKAQKSDRKGKRKAKRKSLDA